MTAESVEGRTEKPGAKLTRDRFPRAVRNCYPRVKFHCRFSDGVRTAPAYNRTQQHLCACSKSQTLTELPLFGHTKILHAWVGMDSATLAAAVFLTSKYLFADI